MIAGIAAELGRRETCAIMAVALVLRVTAVGRLGRDPVGSSRAYIVVWCRPSPERPGAQLDEPFVVYPSGRRPARKIS